MVPSERHLGACPKRTTSQRTLEGGGNRRPNGELVLLFAGLFTAAFTRQRLFYALLFARLEVKGVTLHFLDDVLLLDLALETPQGVL